MALADPDLPPGIALPELSPGPPLGLNSDRYRWLRDAFYEQRAERIAEIAPILGAAIDRYPLEDDAERP